MGQRINTRLRADRARVFIPPPLDGLPAASFAYGPRRMRSAYTGPALRVRRSVDNVETDIGFTAGDLDTEALQAHVGSQNLVLRSEEFENAAWEGLVGSAETIAANSEIAPDGTLTAERCTVLSSSSGRFQNITLAAAGQITCSVYIKAGSIGTWVRIGILDTASTGNQVRCWVNMLTGELGIVSIIGSGWSAITASSTPVGNGWYRISVTATCTATAISMFIIAADADGTTNRTIGHNRILWGAQLNAGATAQPYYATTNVVRTGNGFVTTYYDQTGNGGHSIQTIAANQPRIINAGALDVANGRPTVAQTGTQGLLNSAITALGPEYSLSVVAAANTASGAIISGRGATGINPRLDISATNTLRFLVRDDNEANNITILRTMPAGDYTVITAIRNGNSGSLCTNGVTSTANSTPGAIGTLTTSTGIGIGADFAPSFFGQLNGSIGEVIAFPFVLTATQRQQVERNQGAYYGITVA